MTVQGSGNERSALNFAAFLLFVILAVLFILKTADRLMVEIDALTTSRTNMQEKALNGEPSR